MYESKDCIQIIFLPKDAFYPPIIKNCLTSPCQPVALWAARYKQNE